jgi:hypothetical protein
MWIDLIALPLSVFFARTPDEMLAFLKTFRPDPASGMPDESSLIPSPTHGLQTPYGWPKLCQLQSVLPKQLSTHFMPSGL